MSHLHLLCGSNLNDLVSRNVNDDLDVGLVELSLGQRLAAVSGQDDALGPTSSSDSENELVSKPSKTTKKKRQNRAFDVSANSLTRTLIQALHSSDSGLLERCPVY